MNILERFLMGVAALLLIIPGTTTDIMGMVMIAGIFVKQVVKSRLAKKKAAAQS